MYFVGKSYLKYGSLILVEQILRKWLKKEELTIWALTLISMYTQCVPLHTTTLRVPLSVTLSLSCSVFCFLNPFDKVSCLSYTIIYFLQLVLLDSLYSSVCLWVCGHECASTGQAELNQRLLQMPMLSATSFTVKEPSQGQK